MQEGPSLLTRGIDVALQVSVADCHGLNSADAGIIYLVAGQTVTIIMSSTAFDAKLELLRPDATSIQDDDGAGGTDARITYTPTISGPHQLWMFAKSNASGAYRLRIQ